MMVMCLFGCGKNEQKSNDTDVVFQATIVEINDGVMLVKPLESYSEAKFAELVNVVMKRLKWQDCILLKFFRVQLVKLVEFWEYLSGRNVAC